MTDTRHVSRNGLALFKFFFNTVLAGYYRRFVADLNLKGTETVLEIGSGTGAAARFLAAALNRGGRLISTDISGPMQEETRRVLAGYVNVEYRLGETAALGLPAAAADLALVHFVLHDIEPEARPETLAAVREALKPGGRLVVREPVSRGHGMPAAEIDALLAAAGFRAESASVLKPAWWRGRVYDGRFRR